MDHLSRLLGQLDKLRTTFPFKKSVKWVSLVYFLLEIVEILLQSNPISFFSNVEPSRDEVSFLMTFYVELQSWY